MLPNMISEKIVPVILIVEDEALVRLSAVGMLEDAGFRMIEAVNSDEALELLAADSDVQLTDTEVPWRPLTTLTRASSCWASALTMLVPRPDFACAKTPTGAPIPLSATESFQFVPATANPTAICRSVLSSVKA